MPCRLAKQSHTHPAHLEIAKDTARPSSHYATVADLGRPGVGVHLGELQLRLGSYSGSEGRVPDDVAEGLSTKRIG